MTRRRNGVTRRRDGMPRLTGSDSIDHGAPRRKKAPRITMQIDCSIKAPIMAAIRIAASPLGKPTTPRFDIIRIKGIFQILRIALVIFQVSDYGGIREAAEAVTQEIS